LRKAALRQRILAERDALAPASRQQLSAAITRRLEALSVVHEAKTVLAYASFGSEYDTSELLRNLLERRAILVLPKIDKAQRKLQLFEVRDLDQDTKPGVWGIREPSVARCRPAIAGEIQLVVVPGVAFDRGGNRLGYGGGYYDRLLASFAHTPALLAPAFALQVVEEVAHEENDVPVHAIVTESEVISVELGSEWHDG
jgi:5-formyltetrahydrofolate cyclo-ligase